MCRSMICVSRPHTSFFAQKFVYISSLLADARQGERVFIHGVATTRGLRGPSSFPCVEGC